MVDDCAAAAVASVVSDSVRPHGRQPPGSPIPGILQARTLQWVAPAACSSPGENARSWEALGEARPGPPRLALLSFTS